MCVTDAFCLQLLLAALPTDRESTRHIISHLRSDASATLHTTLQTSALRQTFDTGQLTEPWCQNRSSMVHSRARAESREEERSIGHTAGGFTDDFHIL
jgi:hypothetical protein